jgi:predicted nuclease of predicted toxin-antitoxin system
MDANTKFLFDECLSPELVHIARDEFGYYSTFVPWLGAPPSGSKAWKDWQIVDFLRVDPHVLITNNRRDFVGKYFERGDFNPHSGLVVFLEKNEIDQQKELFRAIMNFIRSLNGLGNRLIEIDNSANIRTAEWPDARALRPWADPFAK